MYRRFWYHKKRPPFHNNCVVLVGRKALDIEKFNQRFPKLVKKGTDLC